MVASVRIRSNTIQLKKEIEQIQKKFPRTIKEILANVSALQIRNIRIRTEKGKSVNGSPFRPYSTKPFFSIQNQSQTLYINFLKVATESIEHLKADQQHQILILVERCYLL